MTRKALTIDEINAALNTLPEWRGDPDGIEREFKFGSYEAGVAFAVQVSLIAQRLDHHPDITIGWQRVVVAFVTHDAGGVTARDVEAAREIEKATSRP